jgi:DNA-binding transcriptional regulator YhcF (GntR family)
MNKKSFKAYNYLLKQLESGLWDDGSKFPGARKLALDAGCGFPLMQTVIEILCQQGILVTKPRSGTYVVKNWRQRLLANNIFIAQPALREIIARKNSLPDGLRISKEFDIGMFELRVSHYLLSNHEEYHDLAEIFEELYPDKSAFFQKAIAPFYVGNKLCGIPFIFSPRIILCNRKMFEKASCPLPEENWNWEDFIETIKKLKKKFPDRNIMSLTDSINHWSTFLFRFGGQIYVPESDDPVRIDHPKSIKALQSYAELLKEIKLDKKKTGDIDLNEFALSCSPRQNIYPNSEDEINKTFYATKLPMPVDGLDTNNQAVDLICVRKECSDINLLKDFLKFMLSNKVQNFIGDIGYGLPIRKSSTDKLKSSESAVLKLFCSEIENISTEYHIFSPELYRMISDGVSLSLREENNQKIADSLHELGQALRMFLKIENFRQQ